MGIIKDALKAAGISNNDTEKPVEKKPPTRMIGRVIKVSTEGWGFISSKEIPFTRVFFHWTSLRQDTLNFKDLKKGMNVEFTPQHSDDKGCRAIQIKVIDDEKEE